jgi:hypothetical protein
MVRTSHAIWQILALGLIATLALTSVAIAKHKDGETKIKGRLVEVAIADNGIQMPPTVKHGWVTFRVTNSGTVPHSISARGTKGTWVLTNALPPGETVLVPIKLKKGVYTIWEPAPPDVPPMVGVTLTVH